MQVYANDLNPRSHHYLDVNVVLNKVCFSRLCQAGPRICISGFEAVHNLSMSLCLTSASEQLAEG